MDTVDFPRPPPVDVDLPKGFFYEYKAYDHRIIGYHPREVKAVVSWKSTWEAASSQFSSACHHVRYFMNATPNLDGNLVHMLKDFLSTYEVPKPRRNERRDGPSTQPIPVSSATQSAEAIQWYVNYIKNVRIENGNLEFLVDWTDSSICLSQAWFLLERGTDFEGMKDAFNEKVAKYFFDWKEQHLRNRNHGMRPFSWVKEEKERKGRRRPGIVYVVPESQRTENRAAITVAPSAGRRRVQLRQPPQSTAAPAAPSNARRGQPRQPPQDVGGFPTVTSRSRRGQSRLPPQADADIPVFKYKRDSSADRGIKKELVWEGPLNPVLEYADIGQEPLERDALEALMKVPRNSRRGQPRQPPQADGGFQVSGRALLPQFFDANIKHEAAPDAEYAEGQGLRSLEFHNDWLARQEGGASESGDVEQPFSGFLVPKQEVPDGDYPDASMQNGDGPGRYSFKVDLPVNKPKKPKDEPVDEDASSPPTKKARLQRKKKDGKKV